MFGFKWLNCLNSDDEDGNSYEYDQPVIGPNPHKYNHKKGWGRRKVKPEE